MLVRIHLPHGHGPRGPGNYLVDVDEARGLAAAGVADAITPVTPQTGYADEGVVAATLELADALFPAPPPAVVEAVDVDPALAAVDADTTIADVIADAPPAEGGDL
jgi:hypothetical protein